MFPLSIILEVVGQRIVRLLLREFFWLGCHSIQLPSLASDELVSQLSICSTGSIRKEVLYESLNRVIFAKSELVLCSPEYPSIRVPGR